MAQSLPTAESADPAAAAELEEEISYLAKRHRVTPAIVREIVRRLGSSERAAVSGPDGPEEFRALLAMVENLSDRIVSVEARAEDAEREAHQAHEEVSCLRDQVAAAERDQQDLKTARARLARIQVRGLIARILNRH